jgi:hypothetical protein
MVHRSTEAQSSFRAYDAGSARALIEKIEDSPLMQVMNGQGMMGEAFSTPKFGKSKGPEAPQNYGFTSVVAKASKGAGGVIKQCAEGFMNFIGGNRSFPVMPMMDDRRHRLKNLIKDAAEGSVAMHGLKEWGQQFLMTDDGVYLTGNSGSQGGGSGGGGGAARGAARDASGGGGGGSSGQQKNFQIMLQLVENQNGKTQQQSSSPGAQQLARSFISKDSGVEFEIETYVLNAEESQLYDELIAKGKSRAEAERIVEARAGQIQLLAGGDGGSGGGSSSGGTGAAGSSKPTGQKTLHKQQSNIYQQMDKDKIFVKHGDGYQNVTPSISQTYHQDPKHDTRCDQNHVHIGWEDSNKVWVDKDGCWSSKPIKIRNCDDQNSSSGSGPPPTSGPPAYSASDPLALDNNGNMSLAAQAPLGVASSTALARSIEHPVPDIGPKTVNPLILNFKSPLYMDTDGFLTSTGGGAAGVPEAPTDGLMYGRQSVSGTPSWQRALAITNDILDGGNF